VGLDVKLALVVHYEDHCRWAGDLGVTNAPAFIRCFIREVVLSSCWQQSAYFDYICDIT
jgi:hypothetical protein